jgi:hypothetical protein
MTNNLGKIKVSRAYKKLDTPTLYSFAHGTAFGTTGIGATVPESDIIVHGFADTMMGTHTSRQTAPSKTLTSNEKTQRGILITALDLNADYLQGKANAAAIAAGDINVGNAMVTAAGFALAGKGVAKRIIGIIAAGIGWILFHGTKSKKGPEGFVYEFGTTTAKGVVPAVIKQAFELSATCMINNLPSGSIIGVRFASIVPVSHRGGIAAPATARTTSATTATQTTASKSKHPVIDFNKPNPYAFSEWYYTVIP